MGVLNRLKEKIMYKPQKISSFKAQVEKYGNPITNGEYKELCQYACSKGIGLSGFKSFIGEIEVVKQVIDDIVIIAADFPLILSKKQGIVLELDYEMGTDFATTVNGHVIRLNAIYYSNLEILKDDYNEGAAEGRFVRGTDWHSVVMHEVGHVVANLYHLKPMSIAMDVLAVRNGFQVLDILTDELSVYSTEYEDGREIISESFSGYYGTADNAFANAYIEKCKELIKGGD
jgi:hypothetical protein